MQWYSQPGCYHTGVSPRGLVRWTWIPVVLVVLYSGWILYSRRADNLRIAEEAEQRRAEQDRKILDKLGSGQLKVLMFYANPPVIRRGDRALLCYGVANAKTVRIEPEVDGVGPAISRCVEVVPVKTTSYKLIATDEAGGEQVSSVEIRVGS
jgi:hypothetical protein